MEVGVTIRDKNLASQIIRRYEAAELFPEKFLCAGYAEYPAAVEEEIFARR